MRCVRCVPALLVACALGACESTSEFSRRFDAERARWRVDREEVELRSGEDVPTDSTIARIRALHAEVGSLYGATEPPPATTLANHDARLRLQIAGSSSLYDLDLAAQGQPAAEIADAYAALARVYTFDPALWFRARLGEASLRERLGDAEGALGVYRSIVHEGRGAAGVSPASVPLADDELVLDLHVHAGILAVESLAPDAAARELRSLTVSITDQLASETDSLRTLRLRERLAELQFLEGRWDAGCALLDSLAREVSLPARRAEWILLRANVLQYLTDHVDLADAGYRDVITVMDGSQVATEARLRLTELLLDRRRGSSALGLIDDTLELGASLLDNRSAEARYWKGQALVAIGRWEDAIPVLHEASQWDPDSPYALLAAIERQRRLARLTRPSARELPALVSLAESVPANAYPGRVPKSWSDLLRERRARELWRESIEGLLTTTRDVREVSVRERVILAAARLARERAGDEAWARSLEVQVQ